MSLVLDIILEYIEQALQEAPDDEAREDLRDGIISWLQRENAVTSAAPVTDDSRDGRECELTYTLVVNVHPEDGEPDGGLPAGVPVEFYKLPDDVAETLKDLGDDYLRDVNGVKPTSIRFLS